MYITFNKQKSIQLTLDDILNNKYADYKNYTSAPATDGSTTTICKTKLSPEQLFRLDKHTSKYVEDLRAFNEKYSSTFSGDMSRFYRHTRIPKKGGDGFRPIDIPCAELSNAQRELVTLFKDMMPADHHTSAFAYVKGRSIVDANKKHTIGHTYTKTNPETGECERVVYQNNFAAEFDFSGFFPSSTFEFVVRMFEIVYPFSLIVKRQDGKEQLEKALSICFLNNGLPQGTPTSPWISNVMMIPFDHLVTRKLRNYRMKNGQDYKFTYTRYADDIKISSYKAFDYRELEQDVIVAALNWIKAPFKLNEEKSRYGNRNSSSSWWLGLVHNGNNELTVGWRNKKKFKAILTRYVSDKKNGHNWTLNQVQKLHGLISYYRQIQKTETDYVINKYSQKFEIDIKETIKNDLKNL